MYAVIKTGGKQYRVTPGQTLQIESLGVPVGNAVEFERVLMVADGDDITLGSPAIDGAKVLATSAGEGKGKKVIVFKYRSKSRYQKKTGHRQPYTMLTIEQIVGPGIGEKAAKPKARRRKKEVIPSGA